jgi:8-oxo-dGTP pyrophosphatase MutT (NUDIX family)
MACLKTEAIVERLKRRLHSPDTAPGQLPDHPDSRPFFVPSELRSAAVLVPIVVSRALASVVLTVRANGMDEHAGQVALPGGRVHDSDADMTGTALREAQEEIGLDPGRVEVLGLGSACITISGYRVVPVVGLIRCDTTEFQPAPCQREVRAVFELPLSHVVDANHYARHRVWFRQQCHHLISLRSPCWPVWGVTAAVLHDALMGLTIDDQKKNN